VQHSGSEGYGMEMLAPGTPDDPMQVIDVRDLAAFLVTLAENNTIGIFNACGPAERLTMGEVLNTSKRVCAGQPGEKTELTWVSAAFLRGHPKSERIDTTVWIPPEGQYVGFHQWSNARAIKAGLTFRPIEVTIRDTLEWFPKEIERRVRVTAEIVEEAKAKGEPAPNVGEPAKIRGGIPPELEREVLADWHKSQEESE